MPIRANDQLYAVAFVDSGTVESNGAIHNYRVSAGVGLRITVPMFGPVPIALDFDFPIVRAQQDHTQIFSFSAFGAILAKLFPPNRLAYGLFIVPVHKFEEESFQ